MANIENRMKEIVFDYLRVRDLNTFLDRKEIVNTASLYDDLGADEMDVIEIVMAFEEEFDVEISDDAIEEIETFGDAVRYVKEALGRS